MASAYKWRLTDKLFSYLTDSNGGNPIINSGLTIDVEADISEQVVTTYGDKEAYKLQFKKMTDLISSTTETKDVRLLDYSYYYDMDESSCGFLQGSVGQQGIQGVQGPQGLKGDTGEAGRGITGVSFDTLSLSAGTRVTIFYTDGTSQYFDVMNGGDGTTPLVDYGFLMSGITNLNLHEKIINSVETDLYPQLKAYFDLIFSGATQDINTVRQILAGLSGDYAGLQITVNGLSAYTKTVGEYVDTDRETLTIIKQQMSAMSGIVATDMEYVDTLNGTVRTINETLNVVSGFTNLNVENIDTIHHTLTGFTEQMSIIDGNYLRMLYDLTQSGDTEIVSLSQIRQSTHGISAITENSLGVGAGLIMAINNNTSSVKLYANQMEFRGDDILFGPLSSDSTTYHSCFKADGSGYLANNNIYWDKYGNMTIKGSIISEAASGVTMKFGGAGGTATTVFNADGSGYLANGNITWTAGGDTTFNGKIIATSGSIGGFDIASNHIGIAATAGGEGTTNWANLSLYKNFLKVGDLTSEVDSGGNTVNYGGYVMFGDDVIPSVYGGAFTATGRIVNQNKNINAPYMEQANYGIFINVKNGDRNYGISSDSSLMAPAFVNTEIEALNFSGSTYKIDFSQHTYFLLYSTTAALVNLPGESSVANSFGYGYSLPDKFGALVTFRIRSGSKNISLKGVYNNNDEVVDLEMAAGDACQLLITKIDGFRYQVINHYA